VLAAKIDELF